MNPFKDQISADFEKAKSAGGARVERIRQIFQDAMSQSISELKQGAGEIRSIAKESTSTLTENLKNAPKSTPQTEVIPVQVEIQDDGEVANLAVELPAEPEAAPPTEQPQTASQTVVMVEEPASSQQEPATAKSFAESAKALIEQMLRSFQSSETYATLQQQLEQLRKQMATLDAKLTDRYGERYEKFKQEFNQDMENTKAWYDGMKADADASGMNVIEYKQAELVIKMGEIGVTIAQKEAKIKQLLRELWQTATKV